MHSDEDCKAGNSNCDREDCEKEAMAKSVRKVCDKHTETKRGSPRWHGMQLGFDLAITVGLDDSGGEICISISWDDEAEIHKTTEEDLVVLKTIENVLESNPPLYGRFSLIFNQSRLDVRSFFLREPFGVLREILWSIS